MNRPARSALIIGLALTVWAIASAACVQTRTARLDRAVLGQVTFDDEFDGPQLDLFDPIKRPRGRWKTCYWFGWQPAGDCVNAFSRNVGPQDPSIVSDLHYNGIDPFTLKDGSVQLHVLPADPTDPRNGGKSWAVGMLSSQPSFSQLYGYFEIRATLPAARGAWPAFWLLPATLKTPEEIDIFENMGVDPSRILCTAHWQDGSRASSSYVAVPGSVQRPHTYGLLWTADVLVWYLDDVEVKRVRNHDLHDPMYLIISGGAGGWDNSGNLPLDADAISRTSLSVDYVRAYTLRPQS